MVKVFEVTSKDNNDLGFDLVDDTVVHMRNDPMFYRKEYFPTFSKIADLQRAGKDFKPHDIVMPMIEKGITSYCKKYHVAKQPDEVFRNDDRTAIFDKVYTEEMKEIEKGEYK